MYPSSEVASLNWDAEKAREFAELREAMNISFRDIAKRMEEAGTPCNFNALRDLEKNLRKSVDEDLIKAALTVLGSSAAKMFNAVEAEVPQNIMGE